MVWKKDTSLTTDTESILSPQKIDSVSSGLTDYQLEK